ALAVLTSTRDSLEHPPSCSLGLNSPHRRVRSAAILAARRSLAETYTAYVRNRSVVPSPAERLADLRINYLTDDDRPFACPGSYFDTCLDAFAATHDPLLKLEAVRLLELGLGDLRVQPGESELYSGYMANNVSAVEEKIRQAIASRLVPVFPSDHAELNRELARLLAAIRAEQPAMLDAVSHQWTAESSSNDDIHYLIVLSLLTGGRSADVTVATAQALLGVQAKMKARHEQPSLNWPLRIGDLFDRLSDRDPRLAGSLVEPADFGKPEHALFASHMRGGERTRAIRKL